MLPARLLKFIQTMTRGMHWDCPHSITSKTTVLGQAAVGGPSCTLTKALLPFSIPPPGSMAAQPWQMILGEALPQG